MLPLKLTLSGIYSYREPQEIDFSRLMEGQLFGIFGPVGSGKSTILEAISFALFNKTERLGGHDRLNYNMMNLQSNSLLVDFEFLNPSDGAEYRFMVEGTRDKKNFEKVEAYTRRAFKKENGEWMPLEKTTAEDIIGLSYDNFRRTVIIPQGKFQEFLMLTGAERSRMLQELFYLDRFDLSNKVGSLDKKNELEKSNLEGQLQQLGEASQEGIAAREELLEKLALQIKEAVELFEKQKKEAEALKELKALFEKKEQHLTRLGALENELPKWSERKVLLERYERCQRRLENPLAQLHTATSALAQTSKRLGELVIKVNQQRHSLENKEPQFDLLKGEYECRETWRREADGLAQLLETRKLQSQLEAFENALSEKNILLEKEETVLASLRANAETLRGDLAVLKQNLPDLAVLHSIQNWFAEQDRLERDCESYSKQAEKIQKDYENLLGQVKEKTPKGVKDVSALKESLQLGAILGDVRDLVANRERLVAQADEEIKALAGKQELKIFADGLQDQEPCPLCGSKEHPLPLKMEHLGERLAVLNNERTAFASEMKTLSDSLKALEILELNIRNKESDSIDARAELDRRIQTAATHRGGYNFEGFSPDAPEVVGALLKEAEALAGKIKEADKTLQEIEKSATLRHQTVDIVRAESGTLREKVVAVKAEINVRKGGVADKLVAQFQGQTDGILREKMESLRAQAARVEADFPVAEKALQEIRQSLASLEGESVSEKSSLERNRSALAEAEQILSPILLEEGFSNAVGAEVFLKTFPQREKEKNDIAQFEQNLAMERRSVAEFRDKTEGLVFDEELYAISGNALLNTENQIIIIRKEETKELTMLGQERLQLAKRQELEAVYARIKQRADGLRILKGLFKGNGFVNYVSRIFLDQLCHVANERFQKLTRNQLRLELEDDSNTFQVRDFLNEGRARSVKTLSGGQMFQASLSLALALAEHIQQVRRADRHFFFLDEGFGSLDKDSLQVVFDTLKSLRREGRYVGIISHVEELQQEIEVCLLIKNTQERGSEVTTSQ